MASFTHLSAPEPAVFFVYVEPILSSVTDSGCQLNDLKVTLDISTFPKLYLLEINEGPTG